MPNFASRNQAMRASRSALVSTGSAVWAIAVPQPNSKRIEVKVAAQGLNIGRIPFLGGLWSGVKY